MNPGAQVVLRPKTRKGRNVLQNKPNSWRVMSAPQRVAFAPGLHVLLLGAAGDVRWVLAAADPHFEVIPESGPTASA